MNAPTRVTPVDLRRTAAQLDAVLLFYWIGYCLYAWQVSRIAFVSSRCPSTCRRSMRWSSCTSSQSSRRSLLLEQRLVARRRDLREARSRRLRTAFAPASRVVIVPDGALTRINFESLPVPGPKRHYWIEDVVSRGRAVARHAECAGATARPEAE